ncbi:hypothetical protein GQ457_13G009640 [Hibiscus cannabinus]
MCSGYLEKRDESCHSHWDTYIVKKLYQAHGAIKKAFWSVQLFGVVILLSCFNFLGLATISVARGNETDQQALIQFKAMVTRDRLGFMES